jgi:hypothetical protein
MSHARGGVGHPKNETARCIFLKSFSVVNVNSFSQLKVENGPYSSWNLNSETDFQYRAPPQNKE